MSITSHTAALAEEAVAQLRAVLERDGFEFQAKPYARFAAKKGKLSVTVYEKGPKVLVQGRDTEDFIRFTLEPEILGEARLGYEEVFDPEMFAPHFGVDESGKGDFFGPLVIAGVYVEQASARALLDAGVTDSKRIGSDVKVRRLAATIRATPGIVHETLLISPTRYNEMYPTFSNLNEMLAWGHTRVIARLAQLKPECPRALSDQFARKEVLERALKKRGLSLILEQKVRGEADIAVAAASILARERFIDWLRDASAASSTALPAGASALVKDAARVFIATHGAENLGKVAKLHFKTAGEVLNNP
jgi:ribonuclease HIII